MACLVVQREVAMGKLTEGEAHIGFSSAIDSVRGLEYRPFITDRIALIAPIDHPWAVSGEPISPSDLPSAAVHQPGGPRQVPRSRCREALAWHDLAPEDLPRSMMLGNSEAIRMAVQEGLGLGFVSTMVASEALAAGMLAIIPIEGMEITKTLYMIRNPAVPGHGGGGGVLGVRIRSRAHGSPGEVQPRCGDA